MVVDGIHHAPRHRPAVIFAGTGHRPEKLFGSREAAYASSAQESLTAFARRILEATPDITAIRSGMALGWDQSLADAARNLGLTWHAFVPFPGQASRWPAAARQRYDTLLASAASVTFAVEEHPANNTVVRSAMMARNSMLVEGADIVLALWDGSPSGTADAVTKAKAQGVVVRNYWSKWVAWRAGLHRDVPARGRKP